MPLLPPGAIAPGRAPAPGQMPNQMPGAMMTPIAQAPRLNQSPALAGMGEPTMQVGGPRPQMGNIQSRLSPHLNRAPAVAGAGEIPATSSGFLSE